MGSKNRHGLIHKSHYSPWLAQSIEIMRFKVGHTARTESYFGSSLLGNVYLYGQTAEKSGISPIPTLVKTDYSMLSYDPNTYFESNDPPDQLTSAIRASSSSKMPSKRFLEKQKEGYFNRFSKNKITEDRMMELSALPVVKLPNLYYASFQFMYRYLSKCQGTKYAVTAVHTPQEKKLFLEMLDNLEYACIRSNDGTLNFDLMSAAWSGLCSSINYIYYKTPEHLCLYNNIIEDRKKYRDSVAYNLHSSR